MRSARERLDDLNMELARRLDKIIVEYILNLGKKGDGKMNLEERNKKLKSFFMDECMPILEKKGIDYSPSKVAFAEIEGEAKDMGLKPLQYMLVLASKHWGAIKTFCRTGILASEPIRERLKDLANYCALMAVLIESKENEQGSKICIDQKLPYLIPHGTARIGCSTIDKTKWGWHREQVGREVTVYDRYRFALPLRGVVIGGAFENNQDGAFLVRIFHDQPNGHIASEPVWVMHQQCEIVPTDQCCNSKKDEGCGL